MRIVSSGEMRAAAVARSIVLSSESAPRIRHVKERRMNKFAKGSIAAGVATLLLLGGGGALAYWNDEAGLAGAQIQAGTLTLTVADGAWADDIALWVPGDSDTYTADLHLTATGDNMQGEVTIDESSIGFSPTGIEDQFTITVAPTGALPAGVTYADGVFTFAGAVDAVIPVAATVAFAYDAGATQNDSQGAVVELADIAFEAKQVAP